MSIFQFRFCRNPGNTLYIHVHPLDRPDAPHLRRAGGAGGGGGAPGGGRGGCQQGEPPSQQLGPHTLGSAHRQHSGARGRIFRGFKNI